MQNGAERLAQKMKKGGFAVGFAVTLAEPALSEMAGCAGYDFVFVDAEHSPLDRRDVFQHIMAAQGAGAAALVRVRAAEPAMIKAILDMGPDGVIFLLCTMRTQPGLRWQPVHTRTALIKGCGGKARCGLCATGLERKLRIWLRRKIIF